MTERLLYEIWTFVMNTKSLHVMLFPILVSNKCGYLKLTINIFLNDIK